jgi:DNA ligase-associated metallophosphoesterase
LAPEIEFGGARLVLLAERAAYLPEAGVLLVADAHFGKAVSFRRLGVPVPEGTTAGNLRRLSAALAATGARRLVFLGDLLHCARGRAAGTLDEVARWRAAHAGLEIDLVRGNHDRRAGDPPPQWHTRVHDEPLALGALLLAHEPLPAPPGRAVLAGHLHPAVVVGARAVERLRLPCFHFRASLGVLPAFGEFTGMHVVRPAPGDRLFAIAGDVVRPLNSWT